MNPIVPTPGSMPKRLPDGVIRLPDVEVPPPPRISISEKTNRKQAKERRRLERRAAMRRAIGGDPVRDRVAREVLIARRQADKARGVRHDP